MAKKIKRGRGRPRLTEEQKALRKVARETPEIKDDGGGRVVLLPSEILKQGQRDYEIELTEREEQLALEGLRSKKAAEKRTADATGETDYTAQAKQHKKECAKWMNIDPSFRSMQQRDFDVMSGEERSNSDKDLVLSYPQRDWGKK